ncbi:hypothetical protein [Rhodoplanes roseus]|uniref:Uncharacterized protein n=1 Tax=Rhodoplanes roseus TaxID=29409 RepID=A0A327L2H7_9BRAD|nr:hypothetical protein [Rhodoplanes roseus]RAI44696.1 hypothetical protein CH341_07720 [Rhodoplanes roseus]
MAIYEILIRGKDDGTIAGAHQVAWVADGTKPDGSPRWRVGDAAPLAVEAIAALLGTELAALTAQAARADALAAENEALAAENAALRDQVAALDGRTISSSIVIWAMTRIVVADADVQSFTTGARVAGAMRVGLGEYWVFFSETLPTTDFVAQAWTDESGFSACVPSENRFDDFVIVSVTNAAGQPADPQSLNLAINRVS